MANWFAAIGHRTGLLWPHEVTLAAQPRRIRDPRSRPQSPRCVVIMGLVSLERHQSHDHDAGVWLVGLMSS